MRYKSFLQLVSDAKAVSGSSCNCYRFAQIQVHLHPYYWPKVAVTTLTQRALMALLRWVLRPRESDIFLGELRLGQEPVVVDEMVSRLFVLGGHGLGSNVADFRPFRVRLCLSPAKDGADGWVSVPVKCLRYLKDGPWFDRDAAG